MPGARIGRPPVRPSVDDPAAIEALCNRLADGMSIRRACEQPECPAARNVFRRMAKDEAFGSIIARAREAQQHAIIDEITDMADAATSENWQVVRLRIWARQWQASKLAARTYGDKVQAEHTGTVKSYVIIGKPEAESPEQWGQKYSTDP
jgi:transposase